MKYLLVVFCFSLLACFSSAADSDTASAADDTVSVAELQKALELRCPDDHYLQIRSSDTGEIIASPSCKEVRAVALADDEARDRMLDELRAHRIPAAAPSIAGEVGEAKQPGVIGFLLGLAAGAFVNHKCEELHVGWRVCTTAGALVAMVCAAIPL